ncbi:MAG: FAD-dependent oxidoreductase [Cyanobacteria bacterium P01_F01_bin.150]
MKHYKTDILIVGGGTGGTVAAIQAARRGRALDTQVTLVSEFSWLGGMLTSAGVSAPDGNELLALQTGIWGDFLRTVQQRQAGGIDHGWVSCFTFEPRVGAKIFADWVQALPNLHWISGQKPVTVGKTDSQVTTVTFDNIEIEAQIILDGTELGDVMALAEIPYRWGWDWPEVSQWDEPSALREPNNLTKTYPVQLPTWVVVMQDFGEGETAPTIPVPPTCSPTHPPTAPPPGFAHAWKGYGPERFINYGRLPGDRFMINWPQHGNDYGKDLNRLVQSEQSRREYLKEARWHTQAFAQHIQANIGQRYGLASDTFPLAPNSLGGGAYALYPYYRESRRLQGLVTVREQDILPLGDSGIAPLPVNEYGEIEAIAIGNYANDHHYPSPESELLTLAPKSIRWGGRWTGTPFALPYRCLIPETMDGFLVCEKNISVSHIANGATRLQPTVMNIGQAAGMAAALCIERGCQPRDLPVRILQEALLTDAIAPAAVIPLLNSLPHHPKWQYWQRHGLEHGLDDLAILEADIALSPSTSHFSSHENIGSNLLSNNSNVSQWVTVTGQFERIDDGTYRLALQSYLQSEFHVDFLPLITLNPDVRQHLATWPNKTAMTVQGYWNRSGPWLRTETVQTYTLHGRVLDFL